MFGNFTNSVCLFIFGYLGLYNNSCLKEWNREGALLPEGLRFLDWQKPAFIINNETSAKIVKENVGFLNVFGWNSLSVGFINMEFTGVLVLCFCL